jgi:hypothetical protein
MFSLSARGRPMPCEFDVDKGSSRLYVRTSGSMTGVEAMQMVEEAERLCSEHAVKDLLLELGHVLTETDDLTLYKMTRGWAEFARGRVHTAFVRGPIPDLDKYVGEILREHGVAWKLFDTRAEAELWLSRKMTPAGPLDLM